MPIDGDLWSGRRVLLTGHTGFKGAWLSLWLQRLGAEVTGLAPGAPSAPSLYEVAEVGGGMAAEHAIDVRDAAAVSEAFRDARPEVVVHLAAQPMVRRSLVEPLSTFEINVMGTANVLEAVRLHGSEVRAVVVVTSDKCYENADPHDGNADARDVGAGGRDGDASERDGTASGREDPRGRRPFVEGDPLGGKDPYSSSKACAELVAAAFRTSFFSAPGSPQIATARAGNVIGGGDWGQDRLLPDAVRVATGMAEGPLLVRNPDAVRPWQHVLNPLSGYLMLAEALMRGEQASGAWNFGPPPREAQSVGWVIERLRKLWGGVPEWERDGGENPPEARWLSLDSSHARRALGWKPAWDLDAALAELVAWHEAQRRGEEMRSVSLAQLERYVADADADADSDADADTDADADAGPLQHAAG